MLKEIKRKASITDAFLAHGPQKAMLEVPLNRGSYTELERGLGFMRQGLKRRPLYGLLLLALAG